MAPTAGYSGTALAKKLGIKDGSRLALIDAHPSLRASLDPLPAGVEIATALEAPVDVVVAFFVDRHHLASRLRSLGGAIYPNGACWVAWPKRASKMATDITEDVVREVALPVGLVDNKVCAIDETWSGLRVVWRKEHRVGPGPPTLPA